MNWFRDHAELREFSMNSLYKAAGISKQGFHHQQKRENRTALIKAQIEDLVAKERKNHKKMGARPMYHRLNYREIGVNKFEKYFSELGFGVVHKRKRIITTDSRHKYLKYPNLTHGLKLTDVNQLWCSDITYYITRDQVFYIVMIEDVYSRRIVGWHASENMLSKNNLLSLKQSFRTRKRNKIPGLIHHSDKGAQYACELYVLALKNASMQISMAGNSLENPYAERLNGTIKNDYLYNSQNISLAELKKELDRTIWLYNFERPHSELDYMTPVKFEEWVSQLPVDEKPAMVLHDFKERVL